MVNQIGMMTVLKQRPCHPVQSSASVPSRKLSGRRKLVTRRLTVESANSLRERYGAGTLAKGTSVMTAAHFLVPEHGRVAKSLGIAETVPRWSSSDETYLPDGSGLSNPEQSSGLSLIRHEHGFWRLIKQVNSTESTGYCGQKRPAPTGTPFR